MKNLTYKINKGDLKEFEKDYNEYYHILISRRTTKFKDKIYQNICKKYDIGIDEMCYNLKVHMDKIKDRHDSR